MLKLKLNESGRKSPSAPLKKIHRRARTRRLRGLICTVPTVARAAGDAQDGKGLSSNQTQAIFTSAATQLGECRLKRDCPDRSVTEPCLISPAALI